MHSLLNGYDKWLDSPIERDYEQRDVDARVDVEERDTEDAFDAYEAVDLDEDDDDY